jgi:hypothetical protein
MNKRRAKRGARVARQRVRFAQTLPTRTTFPEFDDRLYPNLVQR